MRYLKFLIILGLVGFLVFGSWWAIGPVGGKDETVTFVIPQKHENLDMGAALEEQHLVRHAWAFNFLWNIYGGAEVKAGGYRLKPTMNTWQIKHQLIAGPELLWVTIAEGLRKEQIGEILMKILGWDDKKLGQWNDLYKTIKPEYAEGVYFPDTYLLPKDETAEQIGQRFIDRFNEKFAPLADGYIKKNIRWTTGLKIASLIQREAAGPDDMPLISGIIWNRLDKNMSLDIDASLQYIKGKDGGYWWAPIKGADRKIDSPYNTYLNKVLPPTPIANPGLAAIAAALNPAETTCLYYLHDHNRQIHCAETYQGHLENIKTYLL